MAVLHLLHVNINALRTKKSELCCYLRETKAEVVMINETKLNDKPTPRISGFRAAAVRNRATDKVRGGGVAIYVKRSIKFIDISPDVDDIVAIELQTNNAKIAIISYYRPPDDSVELNVALLESYLAKYDHCIIGGDLNAKH